MRSLIPCLLSVAAALALVPAAASAADPATELAQRFPPGSVSTREDVARARAAWRSVERSADEAWHAEQQRCAQVFFVNGCLERARRAHQRAERAVHRLRVEANAVERQLDAQARTLAKAERLRQEPSAEQRAAQEAQARVAYEARQQRAQDAAGDARRRADEAAARKDARQVRAEQAQARAAERAAQAPQRADNARALAERQRRAEAYAQQKARQRAQNEEDRARRQAAREEKSSGQASPPAAGEGQADAPQADRR